MSEDTVEELGNFEGTGETWIDVVEGRIVDADDDFEESAGDLIEHVRPDDD